MNSVHKFSLENISGKPVSPVIGSPSSTPTNAHTFKLKSIFKNLTPHHKSTDQVSSSSTTSEPDVFFFNKKVSKLFNSQRDNTTAAGDENEMSSAPPTTPTIIRQHGTNSTRPLEFMQHRRNSRSEENLKFAVERRNCFDVLSQPGSYSDLHETAKHFVGNGRVEEEKSEVLRRHQNNCADVPDAAAFRSVLSKTTSASKSSEVISSSYEDEFVDSNMMPPLQPPQGVVTDQDGLIVPKKLMNPCLESSDRQNLHRELMFNQKLGKSVLNQKSELQKALQKQKERQMMSEQKQIHIQHKTDTVNGELERAILQRAQRLESSQKSMSTQEDINGQLNPEYLTARAKLRHTIDTK